MDVLSVGLIIVLVLTFAGTFATQAQTSVCESRFVGTRTLYRARRAKDPPGGVPPGDWSGMVASVGNMAGHSC